jgi:hypothetical protein
MTIKLTILILLFSSTSLLGQTNNICVKEIPHYKNGQVDIFYHKTHLHFPKLKIDSLENGFDSLALRLWYHWSFEQDEIMLQIKKNSFGAMDWHFIQIF